MMSRGKDTCFCGKILPGYLKSAISYQATNWPLQKGRRARKCFETLVFGS